MFERGGRALSSRTNQPATGIENDHNVADDLDDDPKKDVMAESVVIKAVIEGTDHIWNCIDIRKHSTNHCVVPNLAFVGSGIADDPAQDCMTFQVHA